MSPSAAWHDSMSSLRGGRGLVVVGIEHGQVELSEVEQLRLRAGLGGASERDLQRRAASRDRGDRAAEADDGQRVAMPLLLVALDDARVSSCGGVRIQA